MLIDPNAEVLRQLTRIADALSKSGPSPWVEWARTLASFVAGIALAIFSISFQALAGGKREQRKMRRIVYRELADAAIYIYEIVTNFPQRKTEPGPEDIKRGFKDPPSMRILNPPWTFEGEDYMGENRSVAYELPEMMFLKRMYLELHRFGPGNTVSIGEFKSVLRKISKEIKTVPHVRKNFRKFAGVDFKTIDAMANQFADYQIPPEELFRLVFEDDASQP